MSFFGKNIKKIRTIKKLSQNDFGSLFGVTRATIGAYEEQRAEPKISTAVAIANYFNISLDLLLKKDITINELTNFDSLGRSEKQQQQHKQEQVASEIPFVSSEQLKEYVIKGSDNRYIANLQKLTLPPFSGAKLRAFEVAGSEMEHGVGGIRNGDIVIAYSAGANPETIEYGELYLIVYENDVFLRRIVPRDQSLILVADNRSYADIAVEPEKLKELWRVYRWITTDIPGRYNLEVRVKSLENEVAKLRQSIRS